MARLNSAELRERVCAAGVCYAPAEQTFYSKYPYKVELSPKFKGLGGSSGKRGCQIDISDPAKARIKLAEFVERIENILANVDLRAEIRQFVEQMPQVDYKIRMGGENSLFYFQDTECVLALVERYSEYINSVTGPISSDHENAIGERNVVMRNELYYGRYRYLLEIQYCREFAERIAPQMIEYLEGLDENTWRAHRLKSCIKYFQHHLNQPAMQTVTTTLFPRAPGRGTRITRLPSGTRVSPLATRNEWSPGKIQIYLSDGNDYIYAKLMAAEFVQANHELLLFSELK